MPSCSDCYFQLFQVPGVEAKEWVVRGVKVCRPVPVPFISLARTVLPVLQCAETSFGHPLPEMLRLSKSEEDTASCIFNKLSK